MEAVSLVAAHKRHRDTMTKDNEALDEQVQHPPKFDDEGSLCIGNAGETEEQKFVNIVTYSADLNW